MSDRSRTWDFGPWTLDRNRGFTLVELQIALLLVTIIAVLLMGALRLGSQTWVKVSERQDVSEHRYQVVQFLRRHLTNARFIRLRTTDGEITTSFFGNAKQVHFVAPFPSFHADGELYWWTLALEERKEAEDYSLKAYYFPYIPGLQVEITPDGSLLVEEPIDESRLAENKQDREPESLLITDGVETLDLEYLREEEQGRMEWVETWEPLNKPPRAIRLNLSEFVPNDDSISLPELMVVPRFADQSVFAEVDGG